MWQDHVFIILLDKDSSLYIDILPSMHRYFPNQGPGCFFFLALNEGFRKSHGFVVRGYFSLCNIFIYIYIIYIFFCLGWLTHPQPPGPIPKTPSLHSFQAHWSHRHWWHPNCLASGMATRWPSPMATEPKVKWPSLPPRRKRTWQGKARSRSWISNSAFLRIFFWLRQILKHVFFFRFDGWTFFGVHFLPAFFLWLGFKSQYFTRRWSYEIFFRGL